MRANIGTDMSVIYACLEMTSVGSLIAAGVCQIKISSLNVVYDGQRSVPDPPVRRGKRNHTCSHVLFGLNARTLLTANFSFAVNIRILDPVLWRTVGAYRSQTSCLSVQKYVLRDYHLSFSISSATSVSSRAAVENRRIWQYRLIALR